MGNMLDAAALNCALTSVMLDEYKISDTEDALKICRCLSLELQFAVLCISSAALCKCVLVSLLSACGFIFARITPELCSHPFHGLRRPYVRLVSY
jgi:hypothetical protein